jgi:hypothetical protein
MVGDFVIRRETAADREPVLRVAAAGMREFALTPDFTGLDAELGRLGEDRVGTVAEFVALVGNIVCGTVVVSAKIGRVGKWEAKTDRRTEFVYLLAWSEETVKSRAWAEFMECGSRSRA